VPANIHAAWVIPLRLLPALRLPDLAESVGKQLLKLGVAAPLKYLGHAPLALGRPGLGRRGKSGWSAASAFPGGRDLRGASEYDLELVATVAGAGDQLAGAQLLVGVLGAGLGWQGVLPRSGLGDGGQVPVGGLCGWLGSFRASNRYSGWGSRAPGALLRTWEPVDFGGWLGWEWNSPRQSRTAYVVQVRGRAGSASLAAARIRAY
jgi:hypothetical protein